MLHLGQLLQASRQPVLICIPSEWHQGFREAGMTRVRSLRMFAMGSILAVAVVSASIGLGEVASAASLGGSTSARATQSVGPTHTGTGPAAAVVNPDMICIWQGGHEVCGSFQSFIPGSWYGYSWDKDQIIPGYWTPWMSPTGQHIYGCIISALGATIFVDTGNPWSLLGVPGACGVSWITAFS